MLAPLQISVVHFPQTSHKIGGQCQQNCGLRKIMNENQGPREKEQSETPAKKKPYQKPSFRYERVFETQALACNKVTGTSHCTGMKKS